MELVKTGKTKDVFKLDDGNYLFKFKDTVTGFSTGQTDPGANKVVGSVEGVGSGALKMSVYYFKLLKDNNILTHYVCGDLRKNEMVVKPAVFFGKGLEFVLRYRAAGSFVRRFGSYCKEGEAVPEIFEVTLKDDDREDPPATKEILTALNLLSPSQYDSIKTETIKICAIIRDDLAKRGLELYDIKLEFGLVNGKITLIDELSAGNMRVYKEGKMLDYLSLSALI